MNTTAMRPLLCAVTTITLLCALPSAASAAVGVDQCPGATKVPETADDLTQAANATFCLVNAERASRGLRALTRDGDLTQAARGHSADMVQRDYFAHVNPDGDTLKDRVREAGYAEPGAGWRAAENLGWGTGQRATPNALVDAWLASDGHRRIMLDGSYRELGICVVTGAPKKKDSPLPGATYTLNLGTIR